MDRDVRRYMMFVGAPAVAIAATGLFLLVFGAEGFTAEMRKSGRERQLARYEQNLSRRMANRLRAYAKDGKCDYWWEKGKAPIGTNVSGRVKYGWFANTNGAVVGWARLADGSVIGYDEKPFRYVDRSGMYLFGAWIVLVALLSFILCLQGWRFVWSARKARMDLELKDTFLDMVSHELNTPLGSIVPLSSALAAGTIRDERRRDEALQTVKRESARMARMIDELLTMVRLRNGKIAFARARCDLREAAAAAANLMRSRYPDAVILVEDGGPVVAVADRDRVEQVAINLIENACRYAPDGTIEVCCRERGGGWVALEVADHGAGIPDAMKSHIFERFCQGEGGTVHGLGLGLAIVSGLVKGMGGKVAVRDRNGGGSLFVVELPVEDVESKTEAGRNADG